MNDSKEQQLASNTIRAKSDQPGEPLQPTIPATHRKRLYLGRLIVLILVAAIAVIVYLFRPVVAQRYEGLGVALCAAACGVLLVRRVIRLMKAEDKFEEEHLNVDQTTNSPSEPNSAGQETNRTTSPPEAGQNSK
jgi:hypothetical protein